MDFLSGMQLTSVQYGCNRLENAFIAIIHKEPQPFPQEVNSIRKAAVFNLPNFNFGRNNNYFSGTASKNFFKNSNTFATEAILTLSSGE